MLYYCSTWYYWWNCIKMAYTFLSVAFAQLWPVIRIHTFHQTNLRFAIKWPLVWWCIRTQVLFHLISYCKMTCVYRFTRWYTQMERKYYCHLLRFFGRLNFIRILRKRTCNGLRVILSVSVIDFFFHKVQKLNDQKIFHFW